MGIVVALLVAHIRLLRSTSLVHRVLFDIMLAGLPVDYLRADHCYEVER